MASSIPHPPGAAVAPLAEAVGRPSLPLGATLVRAGVLSEEALEDALLRQRALDAPLGRILLADRAISPEHLLGALARQADLPIIDLLESPPDPALLEGLDPYLCLELEAVPWREVGRTRIIAIGDPVRAEAVRAAFGGDGAQVSVVIARPEEVRGAIVHHFGNRLREDAQIRCPAPYSCRTVISTEGRLGGLALLGLLAIGLAAWPMLTVTGLLVWALAMNAATTALRLFALFARFRTGPARLDDGVTRLADSRRLPTVSLIVPLRSEAAVAGELIEALSTIDYPQALLDVKLVLEEEDLVTRFAIERAALPPCFEVVTVPRDRSLQTKPRAMNFALPFCRGSIVGIYDAEDRPEPGQIRAVVEALLDAPPEVACVQGYLDFYNPAQNWLARCFTIEYAMWFRILLHGVQKLGLPIPLGGTTVFFRRRALEAIGAWDAHNVTEDADLGMRLARFGYRCEMIRTVTLEEANCRPWRWIRQRARWLKGYVITWLTHMREPLRLWRDLGPRGFVGFQILFLGGVTSYLAIPLFWGIWAGLAGFGTAHWLDAPPFLLAGFLISLALGQVVTLLVGFVALRDSRRTGFLPWLPLLLFYWPLGAVAAYKAIGEIFLRPFHWCKTEHGFAQASAPPRTAPPDRPS